jgi:transcriptional regulator of acetoin/glycerol metabolism
MMKRWNRRSKKGRWMHHAATWDMWLVNLLGHILPQRAREEWLGDLKEARRNLLLQGYPNWAVMLITITTAAVLVRSLLRIKYEDLGLTKKHRLLEPDDVLSTEELFRRIATAKGNVFITHQRAGVRMSLARAIHFVARRNKPFVVFDCEATPQELIEKRVFGEIGDGTSHYAGCLQLANSGTLFLDQIHKLPLTLQEKLLLAVSEGIFTPVGGSVPIEFEARIVVGSSRNMVHELRRSRFRQDLYYRLNVIPLGSSQGSFLRLADSLQ